MAEKVPPLTERIEQILKKQKSLNTRKSANKDNSKKTKIVDSITSAQSSLSKCNDDIFSDKKNRNVCKFKSLPVKLGPEAECGESEEKKKFIEYNNHTHLSNPQDIESTNPSRFENHNATSSDSNFNCLGNVDHVKMKDASDISLNTETEFDGHIPHGNSEVNNMEKVGNIKGDKFQETHGIIRSSDEIDEPRTMTSNLISLGHKKNVYLQERRKILVHANSSSSPDTPQKREKDTVKSPSKVAKQEVKGGEKKRRRGFLIGQKVGCVTDQTAETPSIKTFEEDECTTSFKEISEEKMLANNTDSATEIIQSIDTFLCDTTLQKNKKIDPKTNEPVTLQILDESRSGSSKGEEHENTVNIVKKESSAIDNLVSTHVVEEHRDSLENIHIQFEDQESPVPVKKAMESDQKHIRDELEGSTVEEFKTQFDENPVLESIAMPMETNCNSKGIINVGEKDEAGDFKTQFDNSESTSTQNRGSCQKDDEPYSHIPKDTLGESTTSPKIMTPPVRRKVKRAKRRSSDFQVISAAITLSPLQSPSEQDKNLMFPGPTYRRSRRLKRKSIEIYRASKYIAESENAEEQISDETVGSDQNLQKEMEAVGDIAEGKVNEGENEGASVSARVESHVNKNEPKALVKTMPKATLDGDAGLLKESKEEILESVAKSEERPQEKVQETLQETPQTNSRPKRKASQGVNYISESVEISEETNSNNKAPSKGRRGKKAKSEPTVEEIYRNKLWRSQMPKDKTWETIFETPQVNKTGTEELQSAKKFKRHVNFDEFYTNIRLKKRRQKAVQRGWKPLTKKRQETAEKLLFEKLTALQDILDMQSQIKSQVDDVNSMESNEEKILAPAKDINELARFKDGHIMVSPKSDDSKDITEEGDDDVFELPVQSDLPQPKFYVSTTSQNDTSTAGIEFSLDSEASEKNTSLQANVGCNSNIAFSPQY